jgi:succinoglycan biosynthesis transport protein ExoP
MYRRNRDDNQNGPDHRGMIVREEQHQQIMAYTGTGEQGIAQAEEKPLDLRAYWSVIVRRKWLIAIVVLLVLFGAFIMTSLETPIYRSTTTIEIGQESGNITSFDNVAMSSTGTQDYFWTQYELIQSRTVAGRVASDLGLVSVSQVSGEQIQSMLGQFGSWLISLVTMTKGLFVGEPVDQADTASAAPSSASSIQNHLLSNLTLETIRQSRVISISYDSPDPKLAAKIINAWADAVVNINLERRFDATAYAKEFLTERLKQVRVNLEDSENKLVDHAKEMEVVDFEHKQAELLKKIADLNSKIGEIEARRITSESQYREMQASGDTGFSKFQDNSIIQGYKQRLGDLETEYQTSLKIYKPAYPKMVQLRKEIDEIKSNMAKEIDFIKSSIRTEYNTALREESILKKQLEEQQREILSLRNNSTSYMALKRDVETNRNLYDGLLQRMKEVGVAAGLTTNNISVIDRGLVAMTPYKPNMQKNLLLALIAGLVIGIGMAFLFEHLDDTVKSPMELEKLTGLTILGIIPEIDTKLEGVNDVAELVRKDPRSAVAEAYRSCRTALSFSTTSGAPVVLQVTSAAMGEGKSSTILSLALTYIHAGKRVLVIDADLRNPSMHKKTHLANEIGLSNFLVGNKAVNEVIQKTDEEGLYVLTTGPLPPNPVELLSSERMQDFVSKAAEKFDYVLIDSPPVLGLSDALVLAHISDATLFVVDAGVTRKGAVDGSIKRLRSANAYLVGSVFAKYGGTNKGYGYDYSYNYHYYGYGSDPAKKKGRRRLASAA